MASGARALSLDRSVSGWRRPLLTLGLPSSATAAIMLAAFQQYGLQPGPLLFASRPDLVWTLVASLFIGNLMLLVLNLPLAGVWARIMWCPGGCSSAPSSCWRLSARTASTDRCWIGPVVRDRCLWPKRYAIWGMLVARQPDQIAFSIVDAKAAGQFMPSVFPPEAASSIRELATQLHLPPEKLEATIGAFNRAVRPGSFKPRSRRKWGS